MFLSFVKRWCVGSVFLCLSALAFSGCAVTSSGNMLGDAAVLKYSSDQKKYHYVEAPTSSPRSWVPVNRLPHYGQLQ